MATGLPRNEHKERGIGLPVRVFLNVMGADALCAGRVFDGLERVRTFSGCVGGE